MRLKEIYTLTTSFPQHSEGTIGDFVTDLGF